ncbi:NusG domain II-containing protein [Alkaliphilus pronyensis]|uniref:NusG domain II-containing protein n=1 Tax=Alkaliphilus pronyensis TaxID=1482732 RepID=A0A6I0FA53_9FIRM|nr:NusG domain II-containing protein [Alkaliphilus pronyensis]KAB3539700.1 NusG domain II-containing protein [Alkaliphilus pronyensis]
MKLMTTADKILIVSIIIIGIVSMFTIPLLFTEAIEDKIIAVNLDGEVIHRFPLTNSPESEYIVFPFEFEGKVYEGTLELKDGAVMLHRLPEEIVPLSIHTDMGWISESYQVIIALPVRLSISIEASQPDEELDIISY